MRKDAGYQIDHSPKQENNRFDRWLKFEVAWEAQLASCS